MGEFYDYSKCRNNFLIVQKPIVIKVCNGSVNCSEMFQNISFASRHKMYILPSHSLTFLDACIRPSVRALLECDGGTGFKGWMELGCDWSVLSDTEL